MQNLAVPFRDKHLVLTLEEAEALAKALAHEIENAKASQVFLRPVTVAEDGFIDLDSFYSFFVQVYPAQVQLRNRAGKLFGRIVAAARHNDVNFNVICIKCGLHASQRCIDKHVHMSCNENLRIEVASLKQHANDFITGDLRQVGPVICSDLRLLLNYL